MTLTGDLFVALTGRTMVLIAMIRRFMVLILLLILYRMVVWLFLFVILIAFIAGTRVARLEMVLMNRLLFLYFLRANLIIRNRFAVITCILNIMFLIRLVS